MGAVILNGGRERSLQRRHPWVFAGAIARVEGTPECGETVEIRSAGGALLGRGAYSPASQIRVRVWTFDSDEAVDEAFFRRRLARAAARRARPEYGAAAACRLVHGESDGLPGIVVDRYGPWLVCQFLTAGAERVRQIVARELQALFPGAPLYERSEAEARQREGLEPRQGPLTGRAPEELVEIAERDCRFLVDLVNGHKTGFYLDQAENRGLVGAYAAGREVLNAFAYTGGFGIAALRAGAERVVNVESSAPALALAARHVELNGLDPRRVEQIEGNVFEVLRKFRDARRRFGLIVLDPPKFAEVRAQAHKAARGYKDINLLAFKLLQPGGVLFTFSCSGGVDLELFRKIVADAALDAGRSAAVVRVLTQSPDHPVALAFPEGLYLKGLVCVAD